VREVEKGLARQAANPFSCGRILFGCGGGIPTIFNQANSHPPKVTKLFIIEGL